MAEHPTVNRTVAGSSPAAGAHRSEPQPHRLGLRGYICSTGTAYTTALGKGAVGCMVSGVASLYPSLV